MFFFSRDLISRNKVKCDLFEVEAMRDVVGGHESSQQMGDGTGLTTVRPERERVHPPMSVEQWKNTHIEEPLEGEAAHQNPQRTCNRLTCGAD